MTFSLTIFKSIFDVNTTRRMNFSSWESFVELLSGLHKQPGYKPERGEFSDRTSPLISPAIYKKGTTRKNVNVTAWAGWAALDIDNFSDDNPFPDALKAFAEYDHVCYNSASSRNDNPKCRIILRLTEHVPANKIRHLWFALNREFNELGDPQTKDLSRLYYVPADYPGAYSFFHVHSGERILDPNKLMRKHADFIDQPIQSLSAVLPEELQKKLNDYRLSNSIDHDLVNKIHWTSYRNCPFVNQNAVARYMTLTSDWYHELYKIMVSIASRALKRGYPINATQIAQLAREIDIDNGDFYGVRGLEGEGARALSYAVQNI